jgi:hypothetical protein
MPCLHEFHETCLRGWLANHYNCPICRHELEHELVPPVRKISAPATERPRNAVRRPQIKVKKTITKKKKNPTK